VSAVPVSLVGLFVLAVGAVGFSAPKTLKTVLTARPMLTTLPVTVTLRLLFGAIFLLGAHDCRLPGIIRIVAAVELTSAAVLLATGEQRFGRFVAWWLARPPTFVRLWCLAALTFGVVVIYASGVGSSAV